ncbi:hypothetical protein PanWU01x14_341720, partial [Parasponia andersonii]
SIIYPFAQGKTISFDYVPWTKQPGNEILFFSFYMQGTSTNELLALNVTERVPNHSTPGCSILYPQTYVLWPLFSSLSLIFFFSLKHKSVKELPTNTNLYKVKT